MSSIAITATDLPKTSTLGTGPVPPIADADRKGLTKKEIAADHPTWCPGCGDFSVLALYFKLIEKRKIWHEKITTVAGIGCSSRFPYFVQGHGAHFIHGRALPFASGVSLARPDLHVFVFGGDGDAFSIGGNHFNHTARRNIKMTYVVMDNMVYGGLARLLIRAEYRFGKDERWRALLEGGIQGRMMFESYGTPDRTLVDEQGAAIPDSAFESGVESDLLWGPYVRAGLRFSF